MALPLSRRPYDWLFVAYFIVHIPITLCCDVQIIFPKEHFPRFLVTAMDNWIRDYDDQLSGTAPLWLQSFIVVELLFHLPYFFFAAYAFIKGRNWIRSTTLIYATAVIITMVAIMPEAWVRSSAPMNIKAVLMSVYGLWMLMPVLLLQRVWKEDVFGENLSAKGKKTQ